MYRGLNLIGLIIITFLVSTGAVYGQAFGTADLEGTWYVHSVAMDSGSSITMARGTIIFDVSGNVTGGSYSVLTHGTADFNSGQLTVGTEGEISGFIGDTYGNNATVKGGKLNEGKTIFCTVSYGTSSKWSLDVFTKAGGSFSTGDLAGVWHCDAVIYGTGLGAGAMTAYGTIEFDETGENKNAQFALSDDSEYQHAGGSLNLTGNGVLTGSMQDGSGYTFTVDYGKMNPGKSTLPVTAQSDVGDGLEYFGFLTRSGGSFSQKNMAGKWFVGIFAREGGLQVCRYGMVNVDENGKITGGTIESSVGATVSNVSGTLNLNAAGALSGNFDLNGIKTVKHGKMDENKHIIQGQVLNGESGGLFYMVRYSEPVTLDVSELNYSFILDGDTPGPQYITVASENGLTDWSVSSNQSWLKVSPDSGTGSGKIEVSVDPAGLVAGKYLGTVSVTDASGAHFVIVNLTVYMPGQTTVPFGEFGSPKEDVTHQGSIPVTGWALDDVGIDNVSIYLEQNGKLNMLDTAIFIQGARPDVEKAFPGYPMNYKAGWGYMLLTNYLPNGGNGTYTLHAVAQDLEGNTASLGTKTITCDNANAVKPFGALDTPAQGGIASGESFVNFGWVLTPNPNNIPADGSTIDVLVDGVKVGNPVYNKYRADIARFFPGYANTDGAGGHFYLDTTAYQNGVHSIQWTARDSGGNIDGIGSRYFMIQNTGGTERNNVSDHRDNLKKSAAVKKIPEENIHVATGTLAIKRGFDKNCQFTELLPGKEKIFHVVISELEPLEIRFPNGGENHQLRFHGNQLVGVSVRPLPIGSTFRAEAGAFYWQPGFGFIGNYRLSFQSKGRGENGTAINVLVTILPKSLSTVLREKEKSPFMK